MSLFFTEENEVYGIDCSNAVWATDEVHEKFILTQSSLNDVDFVIETDEKLLLVEYKNACIANAAAPNAFDPQNEKKLLNVVRKYYDTLHYLTLKKLNKPKMFVYILEYPQGDTVSRRAIRNKLKQRLPFGLQSHFDNDVKLIDRVEVLSIDEWNTHSEYGKYPIRLINNDIKDV